MAGGGVKHNVKMTLFSAKIACINPKHTLKHTHTHTRTHTHTHTHTHTVVVTYREPAVSAACAVYGASA